MRYSTLTTGIVAVAACFLAGCSTRTDVSLTGNTPAQYSHVCITTQEVWFNTSSTAGPDDAGWTKFPLSNPTTVDVVQDSAGTLGEIATSLRQLPGTYSQIRLIPVDDAVVGLAISATDVGAIYNAEADFTDSAALLTRCPWNCSTLIRASASQAHCTFRSVRSARAPRSAAALGTSSTDEHHWYNRRDYRHHNRNDYQQHNRNDQHYNHHDVHDQPGRCARPGAI